MQFLRIFGHARVLIGFGLLGLLAFAIGCDSGGDAGVSNVTPTTPPPGQSGKDQAAARAKSYPTGAAAKQLGDKPAETKPN
jgi:hypothetical protein